MAKRERDINRLLVEMNKYLMNTGYKYGDLCFDFSNKNNNFIQILRVDYQYFKNIVDICENLGYIRKEHNDLGTHYQFKFSLTKKGGERAIEIEQNTIFNFHKNKDRIIVGSIVSLITLGVGFLLNWFFK